MKFHPLGLLLSSIALVARHDAKAEESNLRASATNGHRKLLKTLEHIGNNGEPSGVFPLGECQGDCDTDEDCADGLLCFLRGDETPTPGCTEDTDNTRNADFCYNPNPTAPPTPFPTPLPTPFPTPVPTLPLPTPPPSPPPTSSPTTFLHGLLAGTPAPTPNPTSAPAPAPPLPSGDFYLKMYWRKGYTWQETTREYKWCVRCSGGECNDGDRLKLNECENRDSNDEWKFIPASDDNKQIYIQHTSKNLCWRQVSDTTGTTNAKKIELDDCDWNDDKQKWTTRGNGEFWESKFEIYSITESGSDARCVNQMHHPKDDEELWAEDCRLAHRDSTSYWEIYR